MKRGCYKKDPNSLRQRIEDLLLEHGGMTISDLVEEFPDHTKGGISTVVCELHDAGTIYIKDWALDQPGQKRYPRPVWDHAQNSKRQPPLNKMRPTTYELRLKQRRIRKGFEVTHTRYIYKMVKTAQERGGE